MGSVLRRDRPLGRQPDTPNQDEKGSLLVFLNLPDRPARLSGDQAQLSRPGGRFGPAGRGELGEDVADVFFGRVEGDREVAGDALIGPARGKQP